MHKLPLPSFTYFPRPVRGALCLATGVACCASSLVAGDNDNAKDKKAVVEKKAESRVKFSYLVETGITASTGAPNDNQLFGRLFDDRNAEPLLNQATFTVERALAPEPGKFDYGFKFQALYGSDSRYVTPTGEFENITHYRNSVSVVEAYGNLHFSILTSGGVDLKLGQFVSPESVETIYPTGNAFYSHSYIFNFGVPFQHLGGVATVHVNKYLDVYGGVTRGANVGLLDDPNDVPSGIAGFTLTLLDGKVVLAANTSVGPENPNIFQRLPVLKGNGSVGTIDTNSALRYYNNVNLTWKITDALTSLTDTAYLRDDGLQAEAYGVSQTFAYQINKYLTASVRGEIFRDDDNDFVLQFAANDDYDNSERGILNHIDPRTVSALSTKGTTYTAVTAGVQIKPVDHLLIRPELRYDQAISGTGPFTDSTQHHQFTGGIDLVITF